MDNEEKIIKKLDALIQKVEEQNVLKKKVLDFTEACSYLGLSESYVYKLTSTKQVPHFCPLGKKIFFKRKDLDEWRLQNRQASIAEIEQSANQFSIRKKIL